MNRWGIPRWLENEVRQRDRRCIYCGVTLSDGLTSTKNRKTQATWEHIINDARIITKENIALCCTACNSSKGTENLLDWINSKYYKMKGIDEDNVADVVKVALKTARKQKAQQSLPDYRRPAVGSV